jgi:hypothetical protein
MDISINQNSDPGLDESIGTVVSVRGDSCSGPAGISALPDRPDETSTDPGAALPLVDHEMQRRFDQAVDSCCKINSGRGYFHRRKIGVVAALDPAYLLYRTVRACPDLEAPLRQLDILKERKRRLGPGKTCLACMYVAMQPIADEDYKDCSAYAAYLLQAEFEDKHPDEFEEWAKTARLKECLGKVRARKRAGRLEELSEDIASNLDLSIRRRKTGVRGSLDGDKFELSSSTLSGNLDLIRADRSGRGPETQNTAGGADA